MPMFIQVSSDVTEKNRHSHLPHIDTANSLAYLFNRNIMDEPSSFAYNSQSKRVEIHTEFNFHYENSKVIAQQINWLLDFEEKFDDRDDYLILYLKKFKNETLRNTDNLIVKKIFTNLTLEDFFGKISSDFLKNKINELVVA